MGLNNDDVVNPTTGIFALTAASLAGLRWAVRTFFMDKVAVKSANAEGNFIDRLETEIHRLEQIIAEQTKTIEELRDSHVEMCRRLGNQRAVLIAIETIVEAMCSCNNPGRQRLIELIGELVQEEVANKE